MFVWSRTVRDDELVLWQLIHVIENFGGGNQFGARDMSGVERNLVSDVDYEDFFLFDQVLKFDSSDPTSTISVSSWAVTTATGLLDFSYLVASGRTTRKNDCPQ